MLRRFPDHEIKQLHNHRSHHQAHQKALGFIPQPRTNTLVGKLKLALQPKTVVIEAKTKRLPEQQQEKQINEKRQGVVLESAPQSEIPQPTRPTSNHEGNQECAANHEIGHTEAALEPVIAARLRRVFCSWGRTFCEAHSVTSIASVGGHVELICGAGCG